MERKTTAEKIIFFVLDMLLIIGAILCILTIDRGQWIVSNPALYQSPEESAGEIPVTQGADHPAGTTTPQPAVSCLMPAQLASPDWLNIYLFDRAYTSAFNQKDAQKGAATPAAMCAK